MPLATIPTLPVRTAPRLALAISAALLAGYGSAHAATYPVTVANDPGSFDDASVAAAVSANTLTLSQAIRAANLNPGADIIELQTDVTVTGVMKHLINSDLTLQSAAGSTHSISGGDQFRPLFIKSGTVTLKNLTIRNGLAKGGYALWGGAGAGLGGGLFVYDGTVLIDNVTFNNNQAVGGNGGNLGHNGGGGMFGNSTSNGGGGLFAASNAGNGGYGGNGHYGGAGGVENNNGDGGHGGFGGGGGNSRNGNNGGDGGFGGGGGYGWGGNGGNGGFGGGGGYGWRGNGGNGGFGGGGGGSGRSSPGYGGYGGGNDTHGGGGGGAGFGGAIFAMKGTLTLKDVSFSGNAVTAGVGNSFSTDNNDGQAKAKDVFICTRSVGNNHPSAALCAATVNQCGTTSTTDIVGTFGTTCPYTITTTAAPVAGGTVTCDPNPVMTASNTTCTATPNSGYVFSSWSGACSGTASCTLSNVTANQSVTGHFKQVQTVAFDAATPTRKTFGDAAFAVTVTTTASGLTATLGSSTPTVCSVAANTVTLLAAGTCTLTANQAGNDNYAAATEVTQNIIVDKASQTITFAQPAAPTFVLNGTFTVAATSSANLNVSFNSSTPSVCSVSGTTVTMLSVGDCTLSATQTGDANYAAATAVTRTMTLGKASQTVAFDAATPTRKTLGDAAFPVTITTTASGLTATLGSSTPTVCNVAGNMVTLLAAGTCTLTANQAGNDNYAAATEVRHPITVDSAPPPIADEVSLTQQGRVISKDDTTPSTEDGTDFGSIPILSQLTQTFTLSNRRTTPITIQSMSLQDTTRAAQGTGLDGWAIFGLQSAYAMGVSDFSLATTTPFTINQGASQNFTLNFTPSVVGLREGIVVITFSDASIFRFAIRGTGTNSATIPIFSPVGLLALLGGLVWWGRRRKRG